MDSLILLQNILHKIILGLYTDQDNQFEESS